jgi:DNA-binding NarL/FixJ family response regulator
MGLYANSAVSQTTDKPVLLIVDDEQGPRESLRMVFKDRYRCATAAGGKEGVTYAREHHVDAAILDIKMPDISGIEVLRELKQIDPHIECVMLTGFETVETARAAVRFGASDYLNKPFDVFAMRDLLDRCLARRQRHLELERGLTELRQVNEQLAAIPGIAAQPLAAIAAHAQSLTTELAALRDANPTTLQETHARLAALHHEVERCTDIARRFVRFSQRHQRETECIEIRRLIEDAAALLKTHPANQHVTLAIHTADGPLPVEVNPAEILQVFLGLGIQSLQALRGGGDLSFTADRAPAGPGPKARCAPAFDPHRPLVRVRLTDTQAGPAAPADDLVVELITRHGGALDIEAGRGVTVYLPLAA